MQSNPCGEHTKKTEGKATRTAGRAAAEDRKRRGSTKTATGDGPNARVMR
jgi:hypothetical protein